MKLKWIFLLYTKEFKAYKAIFKTTFSQKGAIYCGYFQT